MSTKLVDMKLDEISLVKKGANQYSTVSIAKSHRGEEEDMALFYTDGTPANEDDLEIGDVVETEEGETFEVVEDDGDDEGDEDLADDDEDIEKAFYSGAGHAAASMGRSAAGKASRRGRSAVTRAGMSARGAAGTVRGAGMRLRSTAGEAAGRAGATGRSGLTRAGMTARSAPGSIAYGGGFAAGKVSNAGKATGAHLGRNKFRYGAGGTVAASGAAGYGGSRVKKSFASDLREEFGKALTDTDRDAVIQKSFEQIEWLQGAAQEAVELAKSEQEIRVFNEYVDIAKSYTLPFEDEAVASAMMEAEQFLSEDALAVITKSFELASNAITAEVGSNGVGFSETMSAVDYGLESIGKSGDNDAFVAAMEANPGLYDQYLAEQQGR